LNAQRARTWLALHAKADILQPQMDRILPRSSITYEFSERLTQGERSVVDWSFAISKCLRQGMALHPRCSVCSILMGPGHSDAGIGPLCGTHAGLAPRPMVRSTAETDTLAWIARGGED
jgi:hypothetical protein